MLYIIEIAHQTGSTAWTAKDQAEFINGVQEYTNSEAIETLEQADSQPMSRNNSYKIIDGTPAAIDFLETYNGHNATDVRWALAREIALWTEGRQDSYTISAILNGRYTRTVDGLELNDDEEDE